MRPHAIIVGGALASLFWATAALGDPLHVYGPGRPVWREAALYHAGAEPTAQWRIKLSRMKLTGSSFRGRSAKLFRGASGQVTAPLEFSMGLLPKLLVAGVAVCTLTAGLDVASAQAQDVDPAGAMDGGMAGAMSGGGYAPPGIMMGQAGEWMLGYQAAFDAMSGNLVGTNRISNDEILERFMTTPTDMKMQMHMFMAMYAPSNNLTLMAMLPYTRKSMNHVSSMGSPFVERTEGIGDLELRGLYSVYESADRRHRILLTAGVALPTGSIDESMGEMRLEYPMQLGSGTVSFLPGLIYLGTAAPRSWGAEFASNLPLGENGNGYRLGNRYRLSVWGAQQLTDSLTVSVRAEGERWGDIQGSDPLLDPMDEPTKDPTIQGGRRLDLLLGVRLQPTEGILMGQRFFIEAGVPVYQSLDGPQLERSWVARVAWQRSF